MIFIYHIKESLIKNDIKEQFVERVIRQKQ